MPAPTVQYSSRYILVRFLQVLEEQKRTKYNVNGTATTATEKSNPIHPAGNPYIVLGDVQYLLCHRSYSYYEYGYKIWKSRNVQNTKYKIISYEYCTGTRIITRTSKTQ